MPLPTRRLHTIATFSSPVNGETRHDATEQQPCPGELQKRRLIAALMQSTGTCPTHAKMHLANAKIRVDSPSGNPLRTPSRVLTRDSS